MAARINTKFILILIIAAGVVGVVVGAAWYLNRTDATQLVAQGDSYFAEGDFRKAARYYERAIAKEPGSEVYLAKMKESVLKIRPDTAEEAQQLYTQFISILNHDATHHPSDSKRHLALLEELHSTFRRSNSWLYSEAIIDAADDMWERLPSSDPMRPYAKYFRGSARVSPWMHDRLSEDEIAIGERDLEEFLEAVPNDDRGWATLIDGRLGLGARHREAGQPTRAEERLDQVHSDLEQALANVKDGAEVLLVALNVANYHRQVDDIEPDEAQMRSRIAEMVRLVQERDDPWLNTHAAASLARLSWLEGIPDPVQVIDDFLQSHPRAHDQRLGKARLHYTMRELDEAEQAAQEVLDAEMLTVGYLSRYQPDLRRSAASLIVDSRMVRWERAGLEERSGFVPPIEEAVDQLEALVANPSEDGLVLRAQAKRAFAQKNFARAAALFDRLLTMLEKPDYETLMYSAYALEQVRQIGASVERYEAALEMTPGNIELLERLARSRLELKHYEIAAAHARAILSVDPENTTAPIILGAAERELGTSGDRPKDPIQVAMEQAQTEIEKGEYDAARALLVALHEKSPDELRLLYSLTRVEAILGNKDAALAHINRALELSPGNRVFLSAKARLENTDPIETIRQFVAEETTDDATECIEMLLGMRQLADQKDIQAASHEAAGRTEAAEAARALAERARAEEASQFARMNELAPHHQRFIEYRFVKELSDENWDQVLAIVDEAEEFDADQAGGATFLGRYELQRGNAEAAVRAFRDATDQIPFSDQAWRLLAVAYQQAGNLSESLLALERSYTNNPSHPETVLAYGTLLARTGNRARALQVMRVGRRLAPDSVPMREQWLKLEEEVGEPAISLNQRAKYYEENPDEKVNAAQLAIFLGTKTPSTTILLDAQGEPAFTPERWARMSSDARERAIASLREGWQDRAEEIVEAMTPPDERDLAWHALRAELLKGRGELNAGADLLREFAGRQRDNESKVSAMLALANYYGGVRLTEPAVATLREAIPLQDDGTHRAELALGRLYFSLQRYGDALPLLQQADGDERTRAVRMQEAESLVMLRRLPEAREVLDAIEADDAPDATSTMLRASVIAGEMEQLAEAGNQTNIQRKQREFEDALTLAERLSPSDPMPHVMRARQLFGQFRRTGEETHLDDALRALARADQVADGFYQTSLTRVAVLEARGDLREATAELERLVDRSPRLEQPRLLLFQMLLDQGRIDAAVSVGEEGARLDPLAVEWRERLGNVHMSRRDDPVRAAEEFAAGMEIVPSPVLLAKAGEAYLTAEPPRVKATIDLIGEYQDVYETSPIVRAVYARALAAQGRRGEALDEMRLAYAQQRELIERGAEPAARISSWYAVLRRIFGQDEAADAETFAMEVCSGNPDAYELLSLAAIWRESGPEGFDRSAELLRLGLDKCPPEAAGLRLRLRTDLAVVLLYQESFEESLEMFEGILAERPNTPDVLNNTAFLLAEKLGRPAEALPHAELAARLLPNSWSVLDTLGRVHFLLEDYQEAESVLRKSVQLERQATNQFHLAQALERRNELENALRYLDQAAEKRPDSDTREEIMRLADDIRTRMKRGQ